MQKMPKKFTPGNFKVRVRNSKTGKGIFAEEDIPKGACIIEYFGKVVPKEKQKSATGRYMFETGRGLMIDGNIPANTARFINHSCDGNCEAEGPSGYVFIMAKRKIKAGEELTYDYDDEYFDEYLAPIGCKCGSTKCRSKKSATIKK